MVIDCLCILRTCRSLLSLLLEAGENGKAVRTVQGAHRTRSPSLGKAVSINLPCYLNNMDFYLGVG